MPSISILVAGLVLVAYLVGFLWRRLTSPLWSVPGPFSSRFTSLSLRQQEFSANRTSYIHSLHQKYGPVVRIAPNEVSFASYEAVKEIYGSLGSGYDKSPFYDLFTVFGKRTMFSTLDKGNHAKRKRLLADRYANSNVMKPASLDGIKSLATEFARQCGASSGTQSVDIYTALHAFACDGVTHHLFHPHGTDCLRNPTDLEMMHQVNADDSLASRLLMLHAPTLYNCASAIIDRIVEPRATPLADNFVLQAAAREDPSDFTLLARLRSKLGDALGADDIAAECLDHMVAGIDTTGDVLCFLMWELSQPRSASVQAAMREEMRRLHDAPTLDGLPYLDAVVHEGLRCFPAIPMSLPRLVPPGGSIVDGVPVPEGTVVSCQAYSVQRLNHCVFPEPDRFDPTRWLQPKGDAERKRHLFAFSHGGRGCVGKHLALAEMKLLLREVYSRYGSVPAAGMTEESMSPHDQIISARPRGQKCLLRFVPV
ncbi:cytochrome P450 [Plectosphaerella plurivora]|uniref:Cytochrome P450 n=1 Tax=Plectosphaerella plurivora TaxID=936078 RepID=A0A9P9A4Z2_9PEZI|nr:cytochrome P450 [Plectosphaerella plurivora]